MVHSLNTQQKLTCSICYQACRLSEAETGICGVRRRKGDVIESLVYGRVVAENIDPIEKKPLFHVLPGSLSYSIAAPGCNFKCLHCQNSSISQVSGIESFQHAGTKRTPEDIVNGALSNNCTSISYTYVEPTVFFEFAIDCCNAAQEQGLKNIFVSNGYMSGSSVRTLAPLLSGINIDLKAFQDSFYQKVCGATLQPVLDNIRRYVELGVWVEVTTLVIPGMNDSDKELSDIAAFLCTVDRNIPWHVSAFYPTYKMTKNKPTPAATLQRARQIGIDHGLSYVYTGNIPGLGGENSFCHACGTEVISRRGFQMSGNRLQGGRCPGCGVTIPGIWR
jgi:pyruvate formate lyase activating enzyme